MRKGLLVLSCGLVLVSLLSLAQPRELTVAHFWGGTERELFQRILTRFQELHPDIRLVELAIPSEQYRATIGAMVAAGDPPDVFLSAWPSQLRELAAADQLLPLDEAWETQGWGQYYTDAWKNLGTFHGHVYAAYFLADQRSVLWYTISQFQKLRLAPPRTYDEFLNLCAALKEAGIPPIITGGRDGWPLTDWFENLLLRVGGPDTYMQLARHEIPWTDPKVVKALEVWKELLDQGYFAPDILAYGWWDAFLKRTRGDAALQLMGGWINGCTKAEFGWIPGVDFSYFVMPIVDPSIPTNWIVISGNSFSVFREARNVDDALTFVDFAISPEAGRLWAEIGRTVPNRQVPLYMYDANARKIALELATQNVVFDLDDIIPTELSTEFRVQLQKFVSNPDALISVLDAIEAKAREVY